MVKTLPCAFLKENKIRAWQRVQDIVWPVAKDPEPAGSTQRGQQRSWVWMKSHPPVILASHARSSQFFLLKTWDPDGTLEVISFHTVNYRERGCQQTGWMGCSFTQFEELVLNLIVRFLNCFFFFSPWAHALKSNRILTPSLAFSLGKHSPRCFQISCQRREGKDSQRSLKRSCVGVLSLSSSKQPKRQQSSTSFYRKPREVKDCVKSSKARNFGRWQENSVNSTSKLLLLTPVRNPPRVPHPTPTRASSGWASWNPQILLSSVLQLTRSSRPSALWDSV